LKNDFVFSKVKWSHYTGEVGECTNYLLKNDFVFSKVKWSHYTGEVGECTNYWCQIF